MLSDAQYQNKQAGDDAANDAAEAQSRIERFLEEITNDHAHDLLFDLVTVIMDDIGPDTIASDCYELIEDQIKITLEESP